MKTDTTTHPETATDSPDVAGCAAMPCCALMVDPMKDSVKWALIQNGRRVENGICEDLESVRQLQSSMGILEVWIDRGFRTREVDAACILFGWTGIKGRADKRGPWNVIEDACDF